MNGSILELFFNTCLCSCRTVWSHESQASQPAPRLLSSQNQPLKSGVLFRTEILKAYLCPQPAAVGSTRLSEFSRMCLSMPPVPPAAFALYKHVSRHWSWVSVQETTVILPSHCCTWESLALFWTAPSSLMSIKCWADPEHDGSRRSHNVFLSQHSPFRERLQPGAALAVRPLCVSGWFKLPVCYIEQSIPHRQSC